MAQRVAALDCGTNSLRLLICDIDGDTKTDLVREMRIVRLGQDIDATGVFAPEALERAGAVMGEYAPVIASHEVDVVRFCATSAARDAANSDQLDALVRDILGNDLEILTGQQEANASFLGATKDLQGSEAVVVDIGGGSTEFVSGIDGTVRWSTSLDVGSVRMTERFLHDDPPTRGQIEACVSTLREQMLPVRESLGTVPQLIGVAGTITTMAAHTLGLDEYRHDLVHGARLPIQSVRAACDEMVALTVARRRELGFMHPGRADVIGAGALIVATMLDVLDLHTDELVVSEHDILDGVAWTAVAAS